MFITKKHIPRRNILRGAGVTLALPLLDAMVPAATLLAQTAAAPKPRFFASFVCHGMAPGYWIPKTESLMDGELPHNWLPLEPYKKQTVIMSGLHSRSAEPPPGATGADHWVAAAFLCANKPRKTAGADIYAGTTIDQMIANKIGQDNLLPSMQFNVEDPARRRTTAARATAAPIPIRFRGRRRPSRCRWSSTRRSFSSGCSATAAPSNSAPHDAPATAAFSIRSPTACHA